MPVTIEPFAWASELPPPDLSDATRIYNEVWAEWVPGERFMSNAAYVDLDRFTAHPERMVRRLARDEQGRLVGHAHAYWREGPGACTVRVFVDPAHRREGIGRALGRSIAAEARAEGRIGLTLEVAEGSVAELVGKAAGCRPDLVMEQNRTDPHAIPGAVLEGWRAAGERAAGYSLVAFDVPCPTPELAADFIHARHVMNDAPRWEGEAEATYTVDELQAVEAASMAAHQDWWNVGVRHDASGELVGISEMYLPQARPWIVFQGDTGVHPDHRGHGLGAWMKAVNHLRLRAERPEVEIVQTWNADSNEPMLRINRALGFAPVQRYRGWYLPLVPLP
ncbi:MAG: GNAT family N-acetyltransferase [Acidimicrobiales bacterium]